MNAEIFKKVFLPHHEKLYRIAYKLLENQADAEDMLQETYIKLWQKRDEWESLINPESFAVTILKNNCLDFVRKIKPEMFPIYELNIPVTDSISARLESREQLEHIRFIMSQLPFREKQVLELKIRENLSDEEIESRTGLKKGNIKVTLSRARKTIKKLYRQWENDENGK